MAHNAELFDALHRIESLDRDANEVVRRWVDEIENQSRRTRAIACAGGLLKRVEEAESLADRLKTIADELSESVSGVVHEFDYIERSIDDAIRRSEAVSESVSQFTFIA